ncbi:MAG: aspartate carbamoyltransferase catalytic subunit [Coriobacteriia bacterium]|nr:aspartate carbamoyltransferase catalytic subunit [Coriobacteriia bacterium]MBS5478693.1 aspartate carbamoyltransferase catalytic subunit [Coriobacteriia bacterium]
MLSVRNLINTTDLTVDDIEQILTAAHTFEQVNSRAIKKLPTLRGRSIVNLFLEPSTRTKSSFELACKRLGADTLSVAGSSSSVVKGESLVDTIQTLDAMGVDMFICRAKFAGSPEIIARTTQARVINAGDGKHAHPTQALLDLYTIRKHLPSFEGLRVGIVGDCIHSRVVGSLAPALTKMGARVTLVGPHAFMPARPDVLGADFTDDLDAVLPELDVLYMLRVQSERLDGATLPSEREYRTLFGVDGKRFAHAKPTAIVMHPGPVMRGVELSSEVVDDARCVKNEQVNSGVSVRMAAIYLLLGGEANGISD